MQEFIPLIVLDPKQTQNLMLIQLPWQDHYIQRKSNTLPHQINMVGVVVLLKPVYVQ